MINFESNVSGFGMDILSYLPFLVDHPTGCKIGQISVMFTKLSSSLDIIVSQVDRFLALFLNLRYKDLMTSQRAVDISLTR